MPTPTKLILTTTLALLLSACGSVKDANKANFSKAIQAYLNTQNGLCAALPAKGTPFALAKQNIFGEGNQKQADALVDAGLLTKRDTEMKAGFGNKMDPATEYQITDTGKKYLRAKAADNWAQQDAFCTGTYAAVEVDTFTEPGEVGGVKVSQVNFHYKIAGAADWAKSESLRAIYKNFADQPQHDIPGKAVLILTNEGWMHERLFKR